ncbi:hypothetical protein JQX13_51215 [Archangium violaceum]|uniref:hypothetical protein n=1 Tax=Archangium violaceum TaxID=83451 RepID=UPI00193AED15|nr:hypothetical protein [Archangium violaceum]QRK08212.1 hypothetical protein JQX13_51215 [Archangium violaceum]
MKKLFRVSRTRGQAMILGVVTLLILALVVFITFNVTVSVQQKIRLQNYADAKAFSLAVVEARALNHFAYTNRAIASSYVGMANVHAYMSEAAMLVDLKMAASSVMGIISGIEYAECYCCWAGPCCFSHCIHGMEANINSIGLLIDWVSGRMGQKIRQLDQPAMNLMRALDAHVTMLNGSQQAVRLGVTATLMQGNLGSLMQENMQKAAGVTQDENAVNIFNTQQWNQVFFSNTQQKQRIMAETVNATRQDFAWNRKGSPLVQPVLFPQLAKLIKASLWMGPNGTWAVLQSPGGVNGRTGATDGNFPGQSGGMVFMTQDSQPSSTRGQSISSFDWGTLTGTWRHGAGVGQLPMLGPISAGEMVSGQSARHTGGFLDFFNRPHSGSQHSSPQIKMERFMEFNIDANAPFNQPAVFAAVSTDGRVNEFGIRGPYEVAKDGTGTLRIGKVGSQDGEITLTNNERTKAFSKALVYYHRIGDWSDYPNLFNPYWRAKLHPLTQTDMATLATIDTNAATVAGAASGAPHSGGKGVNIQ